MAMRTDSPAIKLAVADSARERVRAGEAVDELMRHPGWAALMEAVRQYQDILTRKLLSRAPSNEGAAYADTVGELRGVAAIKAVALGLIQQGEDDAAEIRRAEEEAA